MKSLYILHIIGHENDLHHGQNILRVLDILAKFPLVKSETKRDY